MKELENKIIEALPRLKELTKGCIVKDILNEWIYEVIDNKYCPQLYSYQYSAFRTLDFKDLENIYIIGHPIKLNDVLDYIYSKKPNSKCYNVSFDYDGTFTEIWKYANGDIEGSKIYYWNLSSVFLSDQSEELKEFLNTL